MTKCYGEIDLSKNITVKYLLFGLLSILIIAFDLISKAWIVKVSGGVIGEGPMVIEGILKFSFIKNDGASMGILGGRRIMLIILTFVILAIGVWYFIKNKPTHPLVLTSCSLIFAGAAGNLIDRILLGYVRDFIDLQFMKFYIFNVADCAICIGAALLIIYAFTHVED